MANITLMGASYSDVPAVTLPKTGGGTATFHEQTGSQTITANGTYDMTGIASAIVNVSGGGGMNLQAFIGSDYVRSSSYTATDVTLTVAASGTYTVSWMGWRSTSNGTSGSQLYIDGSAYGSANTTFTRNYGQAIELTGVSLSAGDVLTLYARARNSSYYMTVGNLIIEQTS